MKNQKSIILLIAFILAFSIAGFSVSIKHKNYSAKADTKVEDYLKSEIIKFSEKPSSSLKKTSELLKDNEKVYMFTDDEFFYEVGENGNIRTIVRRSSAKLQSDVKIDKNFAEIKAKDILKKLNSNLKNYKMTIKDGLQANEIAYTIKFEDQIKDDVYTGNFVIIDLSKDGQILNVVNKKVVVPLNAQNFKISKEDVKSIMNKYFSNHKVISKYTNELTGDNFRVFQSMYDGSTVWRCEITLPQDVVDGMTLFYLIDVNTGEIFAKNEPKLVGW